MRKFVDREQTLLTVGSFSTEASFERCIRRWGGARFHGISIAIDHAARSGLNTCYVTSCFHGCRKHSAATKHRFITLLQSPYQCHRGGVEENQSSRRQRATSNHRSSVCATLFALQSDGDLRTVNSDYVLHLPGQHPCPAPGSRTFCFDNSRPRNRAALDYQYVVNVNPALREKRNRVSLDSFCRRSRGCRLYLNNSACRNLYGRSGHHTLGINVRQTGWAVRNYPHHHQHLFGNPASPQITQNRWKDVK